MPPRPWLDRQAIPYRVETFSWIGWRGVFLTDPDGNTVELVAYEASLLDDSSLTELSVIKPALDLHQPE